MQFSSDFHVLYQPLHNAAGMVRITVNGHATPFLHIEEEGPAYVQFRGWNNTPLVMPEIHAPTPQKAIGAAVSVMVDRVIAGVTA